MKFISQVYQQFPTVTEEMLDVWHMLLNDLPFEIVTQAVQTYSGNNRYAPTIADIRSACVDLVAKASGSLSASEAWELALKAIRRYGYMQENAALDSLPDDTAKITKQMGWRNLCMTDESMAGVARGQFIKAYDQLQERKRKEMQTSSGFKKALEALLDQKQLEEGNS